MKTTKKLLPMKLQYFAEASLDGKKETPEDDQEKKLDGQDNPNNGEKSLDEVLNSSDTLKKEYEEKLQAAVEEARRTATDEAKTQLQTEATEAQKLQAMTDEERNRYETEKRITALEEREAALNRRELKMKAQETLKASNVPVSLADILNYSSAEECNTSINLVTAAFNTAVQEAVNGKLKGDAPLKKAPESDKETVDAKAIENAIAGRR